ncbi:NADH:ubiquinone oxidoreductase subunit K [Inquilinus ginsengisoli]
MMAALSSGDLLRRALGWSLGHARALAWLAAPAVAFALIFRFAIEWLWGDEVTAMFVGQEPSGAAALAVMLSMLVLLFAIALIAVSWHRYVLRGELAPFPADGATFRFALYQIWLGILGMVTAVAGMFVLSLLFGLIGGPSLLQAVADGGASGGMLGVLTISGLITVLSTVPFAFYGLVLPGIAIGDRGLTAAESSRLLRGRRLAVLGALIIALLGFFLVAIGLGLVLDAILPDEPGAGLVTLVMDLVSLALTAVEVSVFAGILAELYRDLRLPELARGSGVPE